ncbi:MAG: phenylacetate--CoA ligase family protein [Mobilitalea sp.]
MEDALFPLLNIYRRLPNRIQDAFGHGYRMLPSNIRYGGFYGDYNARVQRFFSVTPDLAEVQRMQLWLLQNTVNRAVERVPFYRELKKITNFEDFANFPVIYKEDIRNNTEAFISAEFPSKRFKANTGGSSGTPLTFFLHAGRTRSKEQAHFNWFWGQSGFIPGAPFLMIRGAPLRNNALYEYQAIKNCLAVSCYELNPTNIAGVIREVQKFRPQFIHGYPSAVKNFVSCMAENASVTWEMPIKTLFLGSEWLSDVDRKFFESFFNSKVLSWYGHSECAVMGGNSLGTREFYFYPFYGYAELLDDSGVPVKTPGQTGRIVATSFDNFVMPFIRYDTGDLGVLSDKSTFGDMPCLVLRSIEGRGQDFIYLTDETKVSITAFIFGQHLPQFARIREMQLEQETVGKLVLRIAPGKGYSANDERNMLNKLLESVSGRIEINCEYVTQIEKTHRGKHRFLIQNIKGSS